ncbi:hypothetical protein SM124_06770 [Bacillus sp. 31A1R]|uniref:Uncharacterized protein n=1 Tax=Robertmurraya mangrovi TaxID=3098077 RepID=A0ABU5IWC5_9BACI|nr:hypothetical protein [Bacillus sp. 31A1R]MDZ5471447.1 hypothetical protein [Bacillus sp. 31A1R]
MGYKPINEALNECKSLFNDELKLPYKVPPLNFTLQLGRCSQIDGTNDTFEIEYLNEELPSNHYMIMVRPSENGMKLRNKKIKYTYQLKDESSAYYATEVVNGFNLLVFERDGWQYILSIDKRATNKVTPRVLVNIANSFL